MGGSSELDVVGNTCIGAFGFAIHMREAGCGSLRDDGQRQESSLGNFDGQQHHETNASVNGGV